jgi:hypothetical protein
MAKCLLFSALVYEVLYKNVFQLPDVNYAVNKMLHDKTNRVQKERVINEDHLISCGRSVSYFLYRMIIKSHLLLFRQ